MGLFTIIDFSQFDCKDAKMYLIVHVDREFWLFQVSAGQTQILGSQFQGQSLVWIAYAAYHMKYSLNITQKDLLP